MAIRPIEAHCPGQIALAQVYGLYIPINGLDDRQLQRLASVAFTKARFDPDEPRIPKGDPHGGEWTTGADGGGGLEPPGSQTSDLGHDDTGGGGTSAVSEFSITTPGDAVSPGDSGAGGVGSVGSDNPPIKWEIKPPESNAPAKPTEAIQPAVDDPLGPAGIGFVGDEAEWLATLTPAAAGALRQMLLGMGGASLALGFLFIPTNRSPIVEGPIANSPGASYRFDGDMGILQLRQDIGSLGPVVVSEGHIGADGLFRDAQGRVIGRYLSASGVVIEAGALPGYRMLPSSASAPDAGTRPADSPKLCPDPSAENIAGRSDRALAYQEQITGLPRGLEVELNNVRFDGCREEDGTMLEAKGPGFADKMLAADRWPEWYRAVREIAEPI